MKHLAAVVHHTAHQVFGRNRNTIPDHAVSEMGPLGNHSPFANHAPIHGSFNPCPPTNYAVIWAWCGMLHGVGGKHELPIQYCKVGLQVRQWCAQISPCPPVDDAVDLTAGHKGAVGRADDVAEPGRCVGDCTAIHGVDTREMNPRPPALQRGLAFTGGDGADAQDAPIFPGAKRGDGAQLFHWTQRHGRTAGWTGVDQCCEINIGENVTIEDDHLFCQSIQCRAQSPPCSQDVRLLHLQGNPTGICPGRHLLPEVMCIDHNVAVSMSVKVGQRNVEHCDPPNGKKGFGPGECEGSQACSEAGGQQECRTLFHGTNPTTNAVADRIRAASWSSLLDV